MITLWSNHLSVGNRIIDSAHEDILSQINKVDYMVRARDGVALAETFKFLENCLCVYFEVEERIAKAVGIDFARHKLAHQCLLNDFKRRGKILTAKNSAWSDEEGNAFVNYLAKSFTQHIKAEGMMMKHVLDTHYYDFKPE